MTKGFGSLARGISSRARSSGTLTVELGGSLELEGVAHELEGLGFRVTRDDVRCTLRVKSGTAAEEQIATTSKGRNV
jgi:hypothetical protein